VLSDESGKHPQKLVIISVKVSEKTCSTKCIFVWF